jgi:2-isopropylmalate synthase
MSEEKYPSVEIYDTTLRDGTQGEGISFSADDKLMVARRLDELGVHYIEGGWPGSNPKDAEFFARSGELKLTHARLVAFGATRHPKNPVESDPNVQALLEAGTPTVTVFGKSWLLHVERALRITRQHNLRIIAETVAYLKARGKEVIYDAEHFFDGYAADPEYALATLEAAQGAGADAIVLCDTNGGSLPSFISEATAAARKQVRVRLGIHTHNDCDLGVANSIAAVLAGATHVQGTINGYGERCGNANLCSLIPVLEVKLKKRALGPERLRLLPHVARYVAELANLPLREEMPFVGRSAFAHKAGVHVSALMKDSSTYEHMDPALVGNRRRVLVSELSGKGNLLYRLKDLGLDDKLDVSGARDLVRQVKELESMGYDLEAAEGTLELLARQANGAPSDFFRLSEFRVMIEKRLGAPPTSHAFLSIEAGGRIYHSVAEHTGPVHALDDCLCQSLSALFPGIKAVHLIDYKVRVLGAAEGTASRVRVLAESSDGADTFVTVGVSENIIEASWQALADAYQLWLVRQADKQPQIKSGHTQDHAWGV